MPGGIAAGKLNKQVTIQSNTETISNMGGPSKVWSDTATVWANVECLSGRELYLAKQIKSDVTMKVTIRGSVQVTPLQRIKYTDAFGAVRYLDIDSVITDETANVVTVCNCIERNIGK